MICLRCDRRVLLVLTATVPDIYEFFLSFKDLMRDSYYSFLSGSRSAESTFFVTI